MSSEKYPFKKRKDVRLAASMDETEEEEKQDVKRSRTTKLQEKQEGSSSREAATPEKEKKWTPPKSPYKLIQEELSDDPWKLLVATIFLNRNTVPGSEAEPEPLVWKFLEKWSSAESTSDASLDEMTEFLQPMGLNRRKAFTLIRFSKEYLHNKWEDPKQLYGIGKYGSDSYKIFYTGEWKSVKPSEHLLSFYYNWLQTNHKALGIE